jgi:hypothetical protein
LWRKWWNTENTKRSKMIATHSSCCATTLEWWRFGIMCRLHDCGDSGRRQGPLATQSRMLSFPWSGPHVSGAEEELQSFLPPPSHLQVTSVKLNLWHQGQPRVEKILSCFHINYIWIVTKNYSQCLLNTYALHSVLRLHIRHPTHFAQWLMRVYDYLHFKDD